MRIFWERYGDGEPTVVLLPTWSIVHSRFWKAQIPYLARHCRVVTFDGRGNGRSDRPAGAEAYTTDEFAADAIAVMDATDTDSATLVAFSCGALWGRSSPPSTRAGRRIVYIAPAVAWPRATPSARCYDSRASSTPTRAGPSTTATTGRGTTEEFLEFFLAQCCNEPHSTKQIEDSVGWALDTTPETLADTTRGIGSAGTERFGDAVRARRCPTLVMHGDQDKIRPHAQGAALAEATGGRLVTLEGSGHLPESAIR